MHAKLKGKSKFLDIGILVCNLTKFLHPCKFLLNYQKGDTIQELLLTKYAQNFNVEILVFRMISFRFGNFESDWATGMES